MPIKRPSGSPLRSRKRPRAKPSTGGINEVGGPAAREEDEEDEDVQADYQEEGGYYVEDIHIPPPMKLTERPTKGERLIIEKIECENFKSYGGVKVMGPFHKSFSAIVGPNGNGKSNIIDAMLFVFGYRAKKIRCKKVSVLIHKSELLPRVSSCAVTVHFVKIIDNGDDDPSDEVNVVPNSKVTVCRRAYQNNSSSYILNGRKVVFAEVAELLKKNGIDIVHNRFLILQGEVEQIAQMPPKATNTHETGFLEFIDEIIGTKRYEKPLEQLKVKMEEIEVTRESKSQRVTLAQQHKQGLVEPMKKATAFLRDRNTKIRTNHILHQVKAYHYRKQGAEKSEKLKGLEETKSEIQNRLDEINKYNEERRQEYAEAEKAYKVAESNYKKYKKRMDDADEKYVTLNREIKTSNDERKKKMKDIEKLAEELEKLQGLPERHGAEIGKLEKRKVELTSDIQTEEKATKGDMDKLIKQMDQCVAEKQKLDAKFRQLKAVVDEKKALRDTLQKELDRSKSNEETEKNKLIKLQEELQELEKTVKRKSGEGLNLDPDLIRKKEAEATKNRGKAASMENLEQEKRATYMNLRGKFSDAQESMRGGMITDSVDKAMFAAKQGGRFGGLYGRLKDLATIDNKYNIGATAASSMTDYWVVDSDQTAAECITFLKEKRLPSQSFLCLNQMGSYARRSKDPFRTPADSLRIFDLFKITHPELAPVFYRAYTDTLIAENIDIASKVAYGGSQRHRTVTCQGEIIETTGSLVGGGNKVSQGKFNSGRAKALVSGISRQQLDALEAQVTAAQEEMQAVVDQRKALESSANALEKEVEELKRKMANYQSDLEASRRMIPLKMELIKQQEQKVKNVTLSPRVLEDKQRKIEEADSEFEEAKVPCDEAEENAQNIAQKLKILQEDKKKEILKKLTKLKEQLKRVDEELNKLNVELRNCEKNKTKIEVKSAKLRSDVESLQEKMLAFVEEKKKLEATAVNLKKEEQELVKEKEEKEQIYTEQKSRANEFDQEEKKLKKQKVTVDNNYQTLHDEVRRIEREVRNLIGGLDKFELSQIPEVEVEALEMLTEEQLEQANMKELESKLHKYTQKLQREEPNLNIIEDYNAACQTMLKRVEELDAVNARRELINNTYLTLEAQRMREFMEGYSMISIKVKELFRMISMGGDAELDLLDSTDPFSCGIDFSVRPRGKTWKKIINLSGGEKTLSSLALVFSLHHFKPSPFYVMDEIDAALDFQNVSIIANYIKDRTKFTQFIIISLRSNMFELADSLLGVYKVDNMSYSIRMGVNIILNKLKGVHQEHNKQFVMGINDDNERKQQSSTVSSSQASHQPSQPQQNAVAGPSSKSPSKRPNFDISAINDNDITASVADRAGSTSPRSSITAGNTSPRSSITAGPNNDSARVENGGGGEDDVMDCSSQDLFADSFAEEEDIANRPPVAASTPCVTASTRTSSRPVIPLDQVVEEADSDDSNTSEIFASLGSSANNSQTLE